MRYVHPVMDIYITVKHAFTAHIRMEVTFSERYDVPFENRVTWLVIEKNRNIYFFKLWKQSVKKNTMCTFLFLIRRKVSFLDTVFYLLIIVSIAHIR